MREEVADESGAPVTASSLLPVPESVRVLAAATVPVKLAALEMVWPLTKPEVRLPVTASVPPMVALLVTAKPVPAAVEASWPEVVILSPAVVGVMVVPVRVK